MGTATLSLQHAPADRSNTPAEVRAPKEPARAELLNSDALCFLADLVRRFRPRLEELLAARRSRQVRLDTGGQLGFLAETATTRESSWTIAPLPSDLRDRRVEIRGAVDRKSIVAGLNSGADTFVADFEDSTAPTWENILLGQQYLTEAVARTIEYAEEATGTIERLVAKPAVLLVRPRGLHLRERHVYVDDRPVPGAFFDFALFAFHNAAALLARGSGPYFYLPKLENHLEARLWNDVFARAECTLGLPSGTIRATALIETVPAAFEMDEILYELRDHSAGLDSGRWDYLFSFIKTFRHDPERILPDRTSIGMTAPFLRAYTQLLIQTCQRRGAPAMGGMATQVPTAADDAANRDAILRLVEDKTREAEDGHDGSWVAHPSLVPIARRAFDEHRARGRSHPLQTVAPRISEQALLEVPAGGLTEEGLRQNVRVGIRYLEAWLRGEGILPLDDHQEETAAAEVSRAQVWQWVHHGVRLEGGRSVTPELVYHVIEEEMAALRQELGRMRFQERKFGEASRLFASMATAPELDEFLTVPAYRLLTARTHSSA